MLVSVALRLLQAQFFILAVLVCHNQSNDKIERMNEIHRITNNKIVIQMCVASGGCNGSPNATCSEGIPNVRACTCAPGYSGTNTNLVGSEKFTGLFILMELIS